MNTSTIDLDTLRSWLGRQEDRTDLAELRPARFMAATLDQDDTGLVAGAALPPLWHWLYFLEAQPRHQLGRDGHPERGGFLPPVSLPNRMWAGGRVSFEAPIPLGTGMHKRSTILRIDHKQGRSGELVFVTVLHEVSCGGVLCVREEHDIVYKGASAPARTPPAGQTTPAPRADHIADHAVEWTPDSTQLFRYSALTFNGHRIHYDADYCREVEHYDHLVIHGPLVATMLAGFGQRVAGASLRHFDYRGLQPATLGMTLKLNARREADGTWRLWSELPGGVVSMQAQGRV